MEKWKLYAIAAALFAGLTSVVAKAGLKNVSADLGLAVRTVFVFVFVLLNLFAWTSPATTTAALKQASSRTYLLLALSALTTTLSWICYHRAMKDGTVAFVSLVDKGSVLVTLVLSTVLLGEPFTWRLACGAALVVVGLIILMGGN